MKRIAIISDTQLPYEDRKATNAVVKFIGEVQPDEVVHIGDLMDFPTPSQWSKGGADEFKGDLYEHAAYGREKFLEPLRQAYSGPVGVIEGNHDERPRKYLDKYAPALGPTTEFNFENLLDFDGFGITKLDEFYPFAPGWVMTHGHRGGIRLNQQAGRTALNAAMNKFHTSVIMGHTHRLGMISQTFGFPGDLVTYTGVEVGNLMDMRLAQYLKSGPANWQQGFAMAYVDGAHVTVSTIPINGGKFTVEGKAYTV